MPLDAFALALGSAFLHALWNLLLGRERDPEAATAIALCAAVAVFAPVAVLRWDADSGVWPYVVVTSTLQLAYFALLATAYRRAEVSVVYPIARGLAPVLVLALRRGGARHRCRRRVRPSESASSASVSSSSAAWASEVPTPVAPEPRSASRWRRASPHTRWSTSTVSSTRIRSSTWSWGWSRRPWGTSASCSRRGVERPRLRATAGPAAGARGFALLRRVRARARGAPSSAGRRRRRRPRDERADRRAPGGTAPRRGVGPRPARRGRLVVGGVALITLG